MKKIITKKHAIPVLLGLLLFSGYAFAVSIKEFPDTASCGYKPTMIRFCHDPITYLPFLPPLPETCVQTVSPNLEIWMNQSRTDARATAAVMPANIRKYFNGYYSATLLNSVRYRIKDSGVFNLAGMTIRLNNDTNAQTLNDTIIFRDKTDSESNIKLWAHELGHVKQYHDWTVANFAKRYLRDPYPVEIEACTAATNFLTWYNANHIDIPLSVNFGTHALGELKQYSVLFKNPTPRNVAINSAALVNGLGTAAGTFSYTTTCSNIVLAGTQCQYNVTFKSKTLLPSTANLVIQTTDALNAVIKVPLIGNEYPALNDTGITRCGNAVSNDVACPVSDYPEQDAQNGRDALRNDDSNGHAGFNFTKLDATGKDLPATATVWNCVRDNVTGLIWENKPAADNIKGNQGLHDNDDTYTWYSTDSSNNGGFSGYPNIPEWYHCSGYNSIDATTYCNTEAFVKRVNTVGWCGYKDWRLPRKAELFSIVDYSKMTQYQMTQGIDVAYFLPRLTVNPSNRDFIYLSSTPNASNSNQVWFVDFSDGSSNSIFPRDAYKAARLVRGGL